jgi:flagellar hook-associated protein FlgK
MRDNQLPYYRQQLDALAGSLITVTNKIQEATGSTTLSEGMDFFTGTRATDISVNSAILAGNTIQSTASMVANIGNMLMSISVESSGEVLIPPTSPTPVKIQSSSTMGTILPGFTTGTGALAINGTTITYTPTETLGQLISDINTHPGLTAVYDDKQSKFMMFISRDVNIQESGSQSLLKALNLSEQELSAAPVNYPGSTVGNTVYSKTPPAPYNPANADQTWLDQKGVLDINPISPGSTGTPANPGAMVLGGVINVNYNGQDYKVKWGNIDYISDTVTAIPKLGTGANVLTQYGYDQVTQKFVFGSGPITNGTTTTISPFVLSDESGNAVQVMKMVGAQNFTNFYASATASLKGQLDSSKTIMNQYKAGLDQTQAIQDNVTKVDDQAELVKAKMYQRAYDASVRLSAVIDEMFNILINQMGTSSSGTQSV